MNESRLRVLHVEDDALDRRLAKETLAADGLQCEITYVDSKAGLESALLTHSFDVVIADYSLPSFDGLTALQVVRRASREVPFIFLSATLGEELAVDLLKEGATDYVIKQRMARLPMAVRRAIREAADRSERRRAAAEVRALNAELEARVAQRTAELAAVNDSLAANERRLREFEELLQAILRHSPIAITVKGLDGRYWLVNDRACGFFGRTSAEIVGRLPSEVLPPRAAEIYAAHDQEVLASGEAVQFEEPVSVDGSLGVVAATRFPLKRADGTPYAVCVISEDITARKQQEDGLRVAKLEAQRASLAKSEFLSHMSHDLRTPLNAILGFGQLLGLEKLNDDGQEFVQQILRAGRHLLDLINEVIDIARIESGRLSLSLEPVPLSDVLEGVTSLIRPLARNRDIEIALDLPAVETAVLADRQRLRQILINLISNAVKYNERGGWVRVSCTVQGERVRIGVSDSGPGISNEKLKLLFRPFERLGAEQTDVEGTGLGLALSRSLAEAMGGALTVESEVGRGSTFGVDLPGAVVPVVAETSPRQDETGVPDASGDVLYIEDNPANQRLMQRILARLPGLSLRTASNGQEAFDEIARATPDLIMLDLHLPDMSGEDILRRLWNEPETQRIPKIVVTADATPGLNRQLHALGASAVLTKPLEIGDVPRTVARLLADQPSNT